MNHTMSPHAEPSPPPSPRTEHRKDPHSSHFLTHLQSIPLLAASSSLLPSLLTSTLSHISTYLPPSLLTRADTLCDTALTQLEHSFPAITTPTSTFTAPPKQLYDRIITRPATVLSTVVKTYKAAGAQHAAAARENVLGMYRTHGEPLLGAYTDGYVRRVNDRLEGAVETGMPKSYREAVGEGVPEDKIELYRTARLARNALERGRVRFYVPLKGVAGKTMDDVVSGGEGIKEEVRAAPGRVRDGAVYVWRVVGEEVKRVREEMGGIGVKGLGLVGFRVGERCVGEVVRVGLMVAAKGTGVVWGMWNVGREKVGK